MKVNQYFLIFLLEGKPKSAKINKEAKIFIQTLLEILTHSFQKINESGTGKYLNNNRNVEEIKNVEHERSIWADNLQWCLLYFDGVTMVNIDFIKALNEYAVLTGGSFNSLLLQIINSNLIEDNSKEIASHLLCASYGFVDPYTIRMSEWIEIIEWNYNFSTIKYVKLNLNCIGKEIIVIHRIFVFCLRMKIRLISL